MRTGGDLGEVQPLANRDASILISLGTPGVTMFSGRYASKTLRPSAVNTVTRISVALSGTMRNTPEPPAMGFG